jgi:hypothetical protein
MNINQLYKIAKNLSNELGFPVESISSLRNQSGSTSQFWNQKVNELQRKVKLRDRIFNRVLKFSRINRQPLTVPATLTGTDHKFWLRQFRELRRRASDPARVRRVNEAITRAPILLEQIREVLSTSPAQRELERSFNTLLGNSQFQEIFDLVLLGARLSVSQSDYLLIRICSNHA